MYMFRPRSEVSVKAMSAVITKRETTGTDNSCLNHTQPYAGNVLFSQVEKICCVERSAVSYLEHIRVKLGIATERCFPWWYLFSVSWDRCWWEWVIRCVFDRKTCCRWRSWINIWHLYDRRERVEPIKPCMTERNTHDTFLLEHFSTRQDSFLV